MNQHTHLARVRSLSSERADALVKEFQKRNTLSPDVEGVYFWDAEISNDLLDTYYTHMSEKTLQNYAADAERGVSFLKGHDYRSLPIGYSLTGSYGESDGRKRVLAGFYTVRGLADTDDLILRMEAKLLRDVSVGFYGGRIICDICGSDFWECRHFPGLYYEEKQGDTVTKTLATFEIDDARLSEVSGVFDGSTPEAMIRKAELVAKAGELSPEQVQLIESRYRIALPMSRTFDSAHIEPAKENGKMTEKELMEVRSALGIGEEGNIAETVKTMSKSLAEAEQRIASLEPQAQEGEQYRADLVAEALAEGVRAQGDEFDKELYEKTLQESPLTVVKRMRDDWRKMADKNFPSGRTSQDSEDKGEERSVSLYPDEAFV